MTDLTLNITLPIKALNGGLFMSPGYGIHPTRIIDSHELIVVRSGTLYLFEDNTHYELKRGDSILLTPGLQHGGYQPYDADVSFYWLHFTLAISESVQRNQLLIPKVANFANPEKLFELFRLFLNNQEAHIPNQLQNSLLIATILTELNNQNNCSAENPSHIVEKAAEYIKVHFKNDISTAVVADALKVNPDYLGRIFKKHMERTVTEEIIFQRLQYACQLLTDSILNISEVALEAGFNDLAYFRRTFKKAKRLTPKKYRNLYSKVHVNTR